MRVDKDTNRAKIHDFYNPLGSNVEESCYSSDLLPNIRNLLYNYDESEYELPLDVLHFLYKSDLRRAILYMINGRFSSEFATLFFESAAKTEQDYLIASYIFAIKAWVLKAENAQLNIPFDKTPHEIILELQAPANRPDERILQDFQCLMKSAEYYLNQLERARIAELRKRLYNLPNVNPAKVDADLAYRQSLILILASSLAISDLSNALELSTEDCVSKFAIVKEHCLAVFCKSNEIKTDFEKLDYLFREDASLAHLVFRELNTVGVEVEKLDFLYDLQAKYCADNPADLDQLKMRSLLLKELKTRGILGFVDFKAMLKEQPTPIQLRDLWRDLKEMIGIYPYLDLVSRFASMKPILSFEETWDNPLDAETLLKEVSFMCIKEFVVSMEWKSLDEFR
jgi:hypothetical protein